MNSTKPQAKLINVAREFSTEPAGRFPSDGPVNGERFRKELLLPALRKSDQHVCVNFDGTEGYGSSFLEEAFGGLVRVDGLTAADLRERLQIESAEDPSVIEEIWQYIDHAHSEK